MDTPMDDFIGRDAEQSELPPVAVVPAHFTSSAEAEAYEHMLMHDCPLELKLPIPFLDQNRNIEDPTEFDLEVLASLHITVEEWRELVEWRKQ